KVTEQGAGGPHEATLYMQKREGSLYMLTIQPLAAAGVRPNDVAKLFAGFKDSLVGGVGGTAKSDKQGTAEGHQVLDLVAEFPAGKLPDFAKGGELRARVYLASGRAYTVSACTNKGGSSSKEVNAYFDAFHLNPALPMLARTARRAVPLKPGW